MSERDCPYDPKCGTDAYEPCWCPFKVEINDDRETLCRCCSECRHNCAMDI